MQLLVNMRAITARLIIKIYFMLMTVCLHLKQHRELEEFYRFDKIKIAMQSLLLLNVIAVQYLLGPRQLTMTN